MGRINNATALLLQCAMTENICKLDAQLSRAYPETLFMERSRFRTGGNDGFRKVFEKETFSMTTLHVYICPKCEHTEVREAGKISPANVPTHCGLVMHMSQYQPQEDDAYTQEEQQPGVFAIYCFDGEKWSLAVRLLREETEQTVGPMHFLFEDEGKRYYRPVQTSPDPFGGVSHADFVAALDPQSWTEGPTVLHTATFEAWLDTNGTLWLSGVALREGFSVEAVQALTRFLSEHVNE